MRSPLPAARIIAFMDVSAAGCADTNAAGGNQILVHRFSIIPKTRAFSHLIAPNRLCCTP
jgi:hypothetical protein